MRSFTFLLLLGISLHTLQAQNTFLYRSDTLIAGFHKRGFKGTVHIAVKDSYSLYKPFGYEESDTSYAHGRQYIIGSISKQITAVLVMQAYEKGNLRLHVPIRKYLPGLNKTWADTVTVHHLLTHTHGIADKNSHLQFTPGSGFAYSNFGFSLLAEILESCNGIPFEEQCRKVFEENRMKNTYHPKVYQEYIHYVVCSSTRNFYDTSYNKNAVYDAAFGGFISTPEDLILWNNALHSGKLLSDSCYEMVFSIKPGASRQHPLFGTMHYGYGTTVNSLSNATRFFGQTGYCPGFASMNFYFPKYGLSVVLLNESACDAGNLADAFKAHMELLQIAKEEL